MRATFLLALLAVLLLPAGCAVAQEKKAAAGPDPAKLERYLRRSFSWPDDVNVTIGTFKPSPVPGLLETTVVLNREGQKQELQFLASADGQYLMQGPALSLNDDPFAVTRSKIQLKDAPSQGSPLASVAIVEYSDMQCPYCKAMAEVMKGQVMPQLGTQVRLVFKNFPLAQIHPWAMTAAELGRCIFKRSGDAAFWPYQDWVFANQAQFTPQTFKEKALAYAKEKGMDSAQLGTCIADPQTKAAVEQELKEGQAVGVNGTPTIFINGRRVVGNQPFPQLKSMIQAELDQASGKQAGATTNSP